MSRAMVAASMKDKSARKWPERRSMKKIGSVFKQCSNCGSMDVFRMEHPDSAGCDVWCWTCGAKDERCWSPKKADLELAEQEREQGFAEVARRHEFSQRLRKLQEILQS
jgi:hypothetical protein